MPAVKLIRRDDEPTTFFYLDPPYAHETRATTGEYQHEMTAEDHRELLDTLAGLRGKFILSGYDCPLYQEFVAKCGWKVRREELPNNAAGGKVKRRMTELLIYNY